MARSQGLEGIDYVRPWDVDKMRRVRRKATLADLERTREAGAYAQAVSDEIRLVLGPWTANGRLPEHRRVSSFYREALAARIAGLEAAPAPKRRASTRVASNGNGAGSTNPLERIAAARRARDHAERELAAAATAARDSGAGVSAIARQLGLTRQGTYKLLARAS